MPKKKRLEKAPLILVHLEIKWSELPDQKIFNEDELTGFHRSLSALGFPEKKLVKQSFHRLQLAPDASNFTRDTAWRYLFRNGAGDGQIEITSTGLVIRQAKYHGFEKLLHIALQTLEALKKVIDIRQALVEFVILHYVDLLLPSKGNSIEKYISDPGLVHFDPKLDGAISSSATTSSVVLLEKSPERIRDIAIRYNKHKLNNGQFPIVVPPELQEPNHEATLELNIPDIEYDENAYYGMIDTRHAVKYFKKPTVAEFPAEENFRQLYQTASDVFWNALSEDAKKEWVVISDE